MVKLAVRGKEGREERVTAEEDNGGNDDAVPHVKRL